MKPSRIYFLLITGIAFLTWLTGAVCLRVLNFDGLEFNGDSYTYFTNAKTFSAAVSTHHFPPPTFWPYGYPVVLSSAFIFGEVSYESGRWVNVLLAGLLAALLSGVMLLIACLKNISTAQTCLLILAAGLLSLGHGVFLKYELIMMSDVLAALLSVATLLFCWRWRASGRLPDIALAGIALGLAGTTRYIHLLTSVTVLIVLLSNVNLKQVQTIRSTLLAAIVFACAALLAFAPQLFITLQDTSSTVGHSLLNDWNLRNFFLSTHDSSDGHQVGKVPSLVYYLAVPFQLQCFTPFGIILVVLGIRYTIRELPRWFWGSVLVWYFSFYFFHSGIPVQNSRHAFPLFLPAVLWMSFGSLECRILWEKQFTKIAVLVTMVWGVSFVFSFRAMVNLVNGKNELKTAAVFIAKNVPPGSKIISTSLYAVYAAYPMPVEPMSIYVMNIPDAKILFTDRKTVFMAIDEKRFIPQWRNHPSGKSFDWIKNNYSCTYKFTISDYIVYEVKPR